MTVLRFAALPLPYYIHGGYSVVGPGRKHPERYAIGEFDLLVGKQGCIYIGEEDRQYELSEGHALVLRPDLHHYPTEGCRERTGTYWVHFQTAGDWRALNGTEEEPIEASFPEQTEEGVPLRSRQPAFAVDIPQFTRLLHPGKMYDLLQRLIDLDRHSHRDQVRWEQQEIFQRVLMQLGESLRAERPHVGEDVADRAASFLRMRYKDQVSSRDLAAALNFHPVYIARRMQKQFGCSPMEYLIRYRIEQAKRLLLQTDLSIGQIALDTGFRQAAYFAACFGKREGMTPREFRLLFLRQGGRSG
ncbi:AraC family transcriptional regulator [Cohnella lubricantis]|uniref:Helix-turn-helix transcriptional regulator n=1 Tax=Cohnella lubricantis TaxID=2163172 RepID=A0A841TCH0_9BACL|nr:AraC family transcriptional regulator [Cohnella lubricantis]MBB6676687.1 helix-turn-helix transcriptional regulator [Cohnella lubricantis]MBP2117733.1 AraC-like DNA-binding protein [Cohnella lubricantis]